MDLAAALAPLAPFARLGRIALLGRWGRPPAGPGAAAGRPAAHPRPPPAGDEPALGCGWFDSSWSLRQGLLVTEHEALHPLHDEPH